jgi:hypothetical protein
MEARQIRGTMGVEWLIISAPGQSDGDAESQWIRAAMMWRRGGSEPRWLWNG